MLGLLFNNYHSLQGCQNRHYKNCQFTSITKIINFNFFVVFERENGINLFSVRREMRGESGSVEILANSLSKIVSERNARYFWRALLFVTHLTFSSISLSLSLSRREKKTLAVFYRRIRNFFPLLEVVHEWRHGLRRRGQWFCDESAKAWVLKSVTMEEGVKNCT